MTTCPMPGYRHKMGGLNSFDYNPVVGTHKLQGQNFQNLGYSGGLKITPHNNTPVGGEWTYDGVPICDISD